MFIITADAIIIKKKIKKFCLKRTYCFMVCVCIIYLFFFFYKHDAQQNNKQSIEKCAQKTPL